MDPLSLGLGFGTGLAIGAAVMAARQGARLQAAEARLGERDAQLAAAERGRAEERSAAAARQQEVERERAEAREALAALRAEQEAVRTGVDEKLALVQQAATQMREAFQALSADALRQSQQSFLELATVKLGEAQQAASGDLAARQQAIAQLLAPMEAELKRVQGVVGEMEKARQDAYGALRQQLEQVGAVQEQLRSETANLVTALRTPQGRGQWGELQLRRVVEMAGMLAYCDFVEQESAAGESGALRPDLIIRLPGGKQLIVDAKTPLSAYLQAIEAPDDAARAERLRLHAQQVRSHILRLGQKAYWEQFDGAPDFVFMFLPGESIYHSALQADASLIEYGVQSRVIPASPVTLIALLRAVAYGWQQEQVAANAREVAELGAELYRRLATLATHVGKIGTGLTRAVESYNDAVGSIERSVLPAARRFRELGVEAKEEIGALEPVQAGVRAIRSGELGGGEGVGG
ncbi:MAG: DNA recombination protein RmuC [Gemmatimonadales bacterium]|nr:DNA recombination protein RmuC [Gemmatimonadales bacterium]